MTTLIDVRLQYKQETGLDRPNYSTNCEELDSYIIWLEERLCEAFNNLNEKENG